ncbi:30S ribosomal protein S7 [Candidatus Woesearchaeota archaeon]|nr:30S ribosomal protein S7 [Candidatus Woesearchaeota archaeon]
MSEIKAFNRWTIGGIMVNDLGLQPYINLEPKIVPKTGARYAGNKFYKSKTFVVERLINKLMVVGHKSRKHFKTSYHITGKASMAYHIVEEVFKQIEKTTKDNPIKIFVKALENAAQREEIITIEYGGARYPKAVECSPQRRIDLALRHITQGAYHRTFNTKKSIVNSLADEIINAYRLSNASHAIAKKLEIERQADSSR